MKVRGLAVSASALFSAGLGSALGAGAAAVPRPRQRISIPPGEKISVDQAMAQTGTNSPKAALDEIKARNGSSKYVYIPHHGAKEKRKHLARLEKARVKEMKKSIGLKP